MKSVEIKLDLNLDEKELAQIELHSFHNVLTVIFGELQFLGTVLGDKSALRESLALCGELLNAISDLDRAKSLVLEWDAHKKAVLVDIDRAVSTHSVKPEHKKLIDESTANIKRILDVIGIRVREFLDRIEEPGKWRHFSTVEVVGRLKEVLDSIARNSRGRYGIVYDPAQKEESDYLVLIDVQGQKEGVINLPPVLLDSLRDLTDNARKYTAPGGLVESSLTEDEKGITLIVSDTGRGIPENEIEKVVRFSVRGSNTKPSETKGGGYGLTKAAYVCRKHGGRMWIESELGTGSRITIIIPKPSNPL